jgi:hypothetical protein
MMLRVPRSLAAMPLLMGAAYVARTQQLEVGPMHLPVVRLLILAGLLRTMMKGERIVGGINSLDRVAGLWAIWSLCSIALHESDVIVFRLGILFDTVGVYYLCRAFIRDRRDIETFFKMVCIVLAPLAVTMLVERFTGTNPLSRIDFGSTEVITTNGHFRAQGPFGHPILAGTVGASCLPMAIYFWRKNRRLALAGLAATLAIIFASGSSSPIMTALSAMGVLALWTIRGYVRTIRWLVVLMIIALSFLMHDPVYYLMARIDITGGSTGYFRAALLQSAVNHLSEWWLAGTDYTRHWMPTGIAANAQHTDMTNYYLQMGVWGGLPLVMLFVWLLIAAFNRIGKALRSARATARDQQFLIWTLGAILFSHVIAFCGISYFDQSSVFLCTVLACIGSLAVTNRVAVPVLGNSMRPGAKAILT